MIGRKPLVLVILGLLVVLAAAAFAPSAFAVQVSHIMYAQENTVVYSYTPASTGTYDCTLTWGSGSPVWPKSEVDGGIWGFQHSILVGGSPVVIDDAYFDQSDNETVPDSFYAGTNPEVGQWVDSDALNHTVYFGVMPYAGDVSYTLVVKFTPTGGSQSTIINASGTATAADGTVYVPNTGTWYSCRQYWAGNATTAYCDWNDYAEGRVATSSASHVGPWIAWIQDSVWYPPGLPATTTIDPAGTTGTTSADGWAQTWYSVVPEIWPSLATPNVWSNSPGGSALPDGKPGTIAANTAPLWYTYSFPVNSVTTLKPAYMWAQTTTPTASKRNFCSDPSTSSTLTFTFWGPTVTWVYSKGPNYGIAKVTIDGATHAPGTVDQYNATIQWQQTTTWSGLGGGSHTIVITSNKSKNAASSGYFTSHDAFQAPTDSQCAALMGATYREENNYDGSTAYTWAVTNYPSALGGTFSSNKSTTAATCLTFQGTSVVWHYIKGPNYGTERVIIDGVAQPNVDLYAAAIGVGATPYNGLAAAPAWHTIFITGTGSKNAASTAYFQASDAFVINPGNITVQN